MRPLIVVGIANSVDRIREYGPRQSDESGEDWSRDYGRFVVEEVKPFIDATYRTLPDAENTGVGGSSMGGLISLHLCQWYPDVFHASRTVAVAVVGSRVLPADDCRLARMAGAVPGVARHGNPRRRNRGGRESDGAASVRLAEEFQHRGLREGEQFQFEEVEGGMHNEAAWGGRLDRVLRFLFGNDNHPNRPVM